MMIGKLWRMWLRFHSIDGSMDGSIDGRIVLGIVVRGLS